jgi:hypothetical protein
MSFALYCLAVLAAVVLVVVKIRVAQGKLAEILDELDNPCPESERPITRAG